MARGTALVRPRYLRVFVHLDGEPHGLCTGFIRVPDLTWSRTPTATRSGSGGRADLIGSYGSYRIGRASYVLDVDGGIAAAVEYLAIKSEAWQSDVGVIRGDVFRDGPLLVVPYDSVDYLETGNDRHRLAGNYPVCVDLDTGECCFVGVEQYKAFLDRGFFG